MTLPTGFLDRPLAHRALHDALDRRPENSLAAVKAATDRGYGIEIDVQLSRDGQAMVFHDYDLVRLTASKGYLAEYLASELGEIKLNNGDEGIPTLRQVLDQVRGRVPLLIEIKDQDGTLGPNVGVLEKACVQALEEYSGPVALMSFNLHTLRVLAERAPFIPRGFLTDTFTKSRWPMVPENRRLCLDRCDHVSNPIVDFISHRVEALEDPRVVCAKDNDKPVICWTVRSSEQAQEALKIADVITFEGFLP